MSNRPLPLEGLRVVDTTDVRGELCTRLLADLGADVIRVEPPGGSRSRRLPPLAPDGTGLAAAVRNTNKRSVTLDLSEGTSAFHELLATADAWVDGHRPAELDDLGLEPDAVHARHPHLVVTTISDFGRTGPYRDYEATDDVLVALGGMLFRSGTPDRPPLLPPGSLAHDVASTTAAFAVLSALWQRQATGLGQVIDFSVQQGVAQISDWSLPGYGASAASGARSEPVRSGSGLVYPLYPCADGFVRLIILSPRQWRAMRAWLGEPEMLQDDHWDHILARMEIQKDLLDPLYVELFSDKSSAELADEAQRRGIVMTPVLRPGEVLAIPHYRERGTFADVEVAEGVHGSLVSGVFEVDGERVGYRHRAPSPGEHTEDVLGEVANASSTGAEPKPAGGLRSYPFTGLKVLDFGHGGVGVETGRLFAEYGADVVKIETRTYPDFIRTVAGSEMSPSFASSSRVKRSFGVNVKLPAGLEAVRKLIAWADVIIENSSTGTMADMGLDYDAAHELNPGIVMMSSQLMGSTGPWKDWIGYGPSTRPASGMTWLWNFEADTMPPGSGAIHPDHFVGRMGAVGALAALIGRERHGEGGAHVEVAQAEALMATLADHFFAESLEPGSVRPRGNRSPQGAPWGVYPCDGEQRWCVISVRDDDDWRRLRLALDDPAWAQRPELDSDDGRREHHDELDDHLAAWCATRTDREVMETLQDAGVPAGMMSTAVDLATDPHLVARGFPQRVDQPGVGEMLFEGPAFSATAMPEPVVRHAPKLGEHTREICRSVLGMSDDDVDKLIADGALEEPIEAESAQV